MIERLMKHSAALWLAALLASPAGLEAADAPLPGGKLNIILILADDLGYGDPGCYGGKLVPTPAIDSLARDGVRCTDGYVTAPLCAPSRCGLMTGAYNQRFGMQWNEDQYRNRGYSVLASHQLLPQANAVRPRVIILSDFPPLNVIPGGAGHGPAEKRSDPDDVQSMVRFLVYANEFDVEGLVASAGTFANIARKQNILDILDLYDQVDENLRKHDSRYPTADQLRAVTWQGRDGTWGKPANEIIGEGRDSEASEAIIKVVDRPDPRPVWVCVWGGPCDVAQAIWKVQKTRSPAELEHFLSKLRVFLIGLGNKPAQDGSGQWMLDNFWKLFVIVSQKTYAGMFAQNSPIGNLEWLNANVREGHGPLCAAYPRSGFNPNSPGQQEGDTPSFLYLYSAVRGMNDPEKPEQESWGGQYMRRDPARKHWYDGPGAKSVSKWLPDMQADFARRADWMKDL